MRNLCFGLVEENWNVTAFADNLLDRKYINEAIWQHVYLCSWYNAFGRIADSSQRPQLGAKRSLESLLTAIALQNRTSVKHTD